MSLIRCYLVQHMSPVLSTHCHSFSVSLLSFSPFMQPALLLFNKTCVCTWWLFNEYAGNRDATVLATQL